MGTEESLPSGFMLTTVEELVGMARARSVWPMAFGLACCGMESMAVGDPRHDFARFGMERASASPRQADLMMVAGRSARRRLRCQRQPSPGATWVRMLSSRWAL